MSARIGGRTFEEERCIAAYGEHGAHLREDLHKCYIFMQSSLHDEATETGTSVRRRSDVQEEAWNGCEG